MLCEVTRLQYDLMTWFSWQLCYDLMAYKTCYGYFVLMFVELTSRAWSIYRWIMMASSSELISDLNEDKTVIENVLFCIFDNTGGPQIVYQVCLWHNSVPCKPATLNIAFGTLITPLNSSKNNAVAITLQRHSHEYVILYCFLSI